TDVRDSARPRRLEEVALEEAEVREVRLAVTVHVSVRRVRLEEGRLHRAEVGEVDGAALVEIRIAVVAEAVRVRIALARVGDLRAVVLVVRQAVRVRVCRSCAARGPAPDVGERGGARRG